MQPVAQPEPLYALEGISRSSFDLEVRRHVDGGREDTLTFGSFGDTGFGLLRMTRGVSAPEATSFYVVLVRQAAQAGLSVVRSTQAAPLATKFGPAEIAEVKMAGISGEAAAGPSEATCLAWRVLVPDDQFSLSGWVCGSVEQPAGAAQIACLIDRLTLAHGEDAGLQVLFSQAERRRSRPVGRPGRGWRRCESPDGPVGRAPAGAALEAPCVRYRVSAFYGGANGLRGRRREPAWAGSAVPDNRE